jgi:phosphoadenosine phosphosulfate reductase
MSEIIGQLVSACPALSVIERLQLLRHALQGRIVFTTSFGIEDQLLTHWIAESGLDISLVTLDTGRLFLQTLDVWAQTEARYGLRIESFAPDAAAAQGLVRTQGVLGFRSGIEARKGCCFVRKVAPLRLALKGASGWITGLRADQSDNRSSLAFAETDTGFGLLKFNPLLDMTRLVIADEVKRHSVPVNALHAAGFISIGCAPCTRAIQPGEAERTGRWWWENELHKECGLHVGEDGHLKRKTVPSQEFI